MHRNAMKERFSLAYIEAIASQAGFHVVESKVDYDSVDGTLVGDFGRRPRIEFQAKATSQDILRKDILAFPLPIKNYDDLRSEALNPRILIVVLMPQDESQWLNQTNEELCLRHCAYWLSLEGEPAKHNIHNVTIHIPLANIFSSEILSALMKKTERRESL